MFSLFGKSATSLLDRLKQSVGKTRTELAARVEHLLTGNRPVDPELLKELESALLSADIGVRTTKEVLAALREQVNEHKISDAAALRDELKLQIVKLLIASDKTQRRVDRRARVRYRCWVSARAFRRRRERHRKNHDHRQARATA